MAGVSTSNGGSTAAFTQIADTTLGADAASITFATIAGTYTHLRVALRARSTRVSANDTLTVASASAASTVSAV